MPMEEKDMRPDPCEAFGFPAIDQVIEGALVNLTLPLGSVIGGSIEGGRVWKDDGEQWWVRMPYGQESATLKLEATCEGEKRSGEVAVTFEKIKWERPINWSTGPTAREFTHMWLDPKDPDILYLYGGYTDEPQRLTLVKDLWRLDLEQKEWTPVSENGTQGPSAAAMAVNVDEASGLVVFSGGSDARANTVNTQVYTFDSQTATWTTLPKTHKTNDLGATIQDPTRGRFLDFLGSDPTTNDLLLSNVWQWTLDDPTPMLLQPVGSRPSSRYSFPYVVDAKHQRVVMFGGSQAPAPDDYINAAGDTWFFDLKADRWDKLQDSEVSPIPRRAACAVYDVRHQRMVLWGGANASSRRISEVAVLDLDKGQERWHVLDFGTQVIKRSPCSGVFDAKHGRALFGFGRDEFKAVADLQILKLD